MPAGALRTAGYVEGADEPDERDRKASASGSAGWVVVTDGCPYDGDFWQPVPSRLPVLAWHVGVRPPRGSQNPGGGGGGGGGLFGCGV